MAAALLCVRASKAEDRVTAGEPSLEPPTLISLGIDWPIEGDDNRNASVAVEYRRGGEPTWRARCRCSPPERAGERPRRRPELRRRDECGRERGCARALESAAARRPNAAATAGPFAFSPFSYVAPNMFSGSVFELAPDTEYEIPLRARRSRRRDGRGDNDGHRAHTRRSRKPAAGGKTYHVYPVGWKGPKQEPAFTGLMAAYYMGAAHFDYQNAFPPRVQPGDIILVHAGTYISDRHHYMNGAARPGYLALGDGVRRHLLPDAERHAGAADRDQGGRRRRGRSSTATARRTCST